MTPWPHQVRAFQRLYEHWPPRLLIADEVGLGKTIQAGMLLRQAWLSGRAKRILVLAPKAVLSQWQIELREKFNLNWPIYDGQRLSWYPSPGFQGAVHRAVGPNEWHKEPCVLASSHLMRRSARAQVLVNEAEPWDLLVLDEAHHARRAGGGLGTDQRPNQLLRLMQALRDRVQGLVLLTATPMQVSPVEVWDLLALLGLPPEWHTQAFLDFFDYAAKPSPSHEQLQRMAELFRAAEHAHGALSDDEAARLLPGMSRLKVRKILRALRDKASIPLKQLETAERQAAIRLMKANTPLRRLISRHTRELLRRYHKAGKLKTPIADRDVRGPLRGDDRRRAPRLRAGGGLHLQHLQQHRRRGAHRGRLRHDHLPAPAGQQLLRPGPDPGGAPRGGRRPGERHDLAPVHHPEEDVLDDELAEEAMDPDEAADLELRALAAEEMVDINGLLAAVKRLPPDSKAGVLLEELRGLREQGYRQVMVFTQYTDTMDFLRTRIAERVRSRRDLLLRPRRRGAVHLGEVGNHLP